MNVRLINLAEGKRWPKLTDFFPEGANGTSSKCLCVTMRYNLCIHFKCTIQWFFGIFTRLCNHHHCLLPKHFGQPVKKLHNHQSLPIPSFCLFSSFCMNICSYKNLRIGRRREWEVTNDYEVSLQVDQNVLEGDSGGGCTTL